MSNEPWRNRDAAGHGTGHRTGTKADGLVQVRMLAILSAVDAMKISKSHNTLVRTKLQSLTFGHRSDGVPPSGRLPLA